MDFLKKFKNPIIGVLAFVGFYLTTKFFGIDAFKDVALSAAAALISVVIQQITKITGVKLDFLNTAKTQEMVKNAILWAEQKAISTLKVDKIIMSGQEKLNIAIKNMMLSAPNMTEEKATMLINQYFPLFQAQIKELWFDMLNATELKSNAIPVKRTRTKK